MLSQDITGSLLAITQSL